MSVLIRKLQILWNQHQYRKVSRKKYICEAPGQDEKTGSTGSKREPPGLVEINSHIEGSTLSGLPVFYFTGNCFPVK